MTLNQLYYFQVIAKYEHFRKASEELNISQPSLSHSISMLEEELGIKLFNRNGRNIYLTKYGKVFLEKVNHILLEINLAKKHMKQLAGSNGHIDIAYVSPLSYSYIPKLVRNFLNKDGCGDVTFSFHQCLTNEIINGLLSEKYDVGFCAHTDNANDIEFFPLIQQKIVLITSKKHPLSKKDFVCIKDLINYPIIGYDKTSALGNFTNKIFREHNLSPNFVYFSPDENAIASLVAEDFGISLVAHVESLNERNVKIIELSDLDVYHNVYLTYKKDNYKLKSINDFINYVKDNTLII